MRLAGLAPWKARRRAIHRHCVPTRSTCQTIHRVPRPVSDSQGTSVPADSAKRCRATRRMGEVRTNRDLRCLDRLKTKSSIRGRRRGRRPPSSPACPRASNPWMTSILLVQSSWEPPKSAGSIDMNVAKPGSVAAILKELGRTETRPVSHVTPEFLVVP